MCADLADEATREREVRALLAAADEHPDASLALITLTPESTGEIPESIIAYDAAVWLVEAWLSEPPELTIE